MRDISMIRLGSAKALTQTGGGWMLLEDNFVLKYDPL